MKKIEALVKELTETCEEEGVTLLVKTFSKESNHMGAGLVGNIKNLAQALVMLDYDIEEVTGKNTSDLRFLGAKAILDDDECDCPNCRHEQEDDDYEEEPFRDFLGEFMAGLAEIGKKLEEVMNDDKD